MYVRMYISTDTYIMLHHTNMEGSITVPHNDNLREMARCVEYAAYNTVGLYRGKYPSSMQLVHLTVAQVFPYSGHYTHRDTVKSIHVLLHTVQCTTSPN